MTDMRMPSPSWSSNVFTEPASKTRTRLLAGRYLENAVHAEARRTRRAQSAQPRLRGSSMHGSVEALCSLRLCVKVRAPSRVGRPFLSRRLSKNLVV